MPGKSMLEKLLPLPYIPKRWQAAAVRLWGNWRIPVAVVLAMIGYAAIQPYLFAWIESLPVLAQQAIGLLFLAAMSGFSVWYSRETRHPVGIIMAAGYIAIAVAIAGGWPDIGAALALVFFAAAVLSLFGGPIWEFVQDRRTA